MHFQTMLTECTESKLVDTSNLGYIDAVTCNCHICVNQITIRTFRTLQRFVVIDKSLPLLV